MVFTGSLASVNTALNGLSFNPTLDFNGAASLQIVSDDQGNTGTGGALTDTDTVNITVNAANDAPVVTATAGNLSYTENDAATAIDPGLTVTDGDNANLTGATVAITGNFASGQDVLAFTNQFGITGNYNSGTGVLTLTGTTTVANYQTALRSVTYAEQQRQPVNRTTHGDLHRQRWHEHGLSHSRHYGHGGQRCAGQHCAGFARHSAEHADRRSRAATAT